MLLGISPELIFSGLEKIRIAGWRFNEQSISWDFGPISVTPSPLKVI